MQKSLVITVGWVQFSIWFRSSKQSKSACKTSGHMDRSHKRAHDLQIGREGDVDLLSVGGDPVQKQRVVHGAVPRCLKAVEGPAARQKHFSLVHLHRVQRREVSTLQKVQEQTDI